MQIYGLNGIGQVADIPGAVAGGQKFKMQKDAIDEQKKLENTTWLAGAAKYGLDNWGQPGILEQLVEEGKRRGIIDPQTQLQGITKEGLIKIYQGARTALGGVNPNQPAEPKLVKDAAGYNRYASGEQFGQRAFPDVTVPEKPDWMDRLQAEDYLARARENDARSYRDQQTASERSYKEQQEEAARQRKLEEQQKANMQSWEAYNAGMTGVTEALKKTMTGPLVGSGPAFTANQQVAEGAIAAIAPILKQLFRSAGEGVFTDKDQELLLAMIPTRKTQPEARQAQVDLINQIVAAKLGLDSPQGGPSQPTAPAQSQPQYEYVITNPQTGERRGWDGVSWVPIQ